MIVAERTVSKPELARKRYELKPMSETEFIKMIDASRKSAQKVYTLEQVRKEVSRLYGF